MTHFRPPRWLRNRHAQTVYGALVRLPVRVPLRHERWELPDGDFLDVDIMLPSPFGLRDGLSAGSASPPMVVVCHGLEGSSKAGYVRGLLAQLRLLGMGAVAINFRGCSGELNRLPRFYHSGDTGDVEFVVERLRRDHPGRALGLAGFSLGGNVVAKYLGERGDAVPAEVRAAAVVSVPFDLAACARTLDGADFWSRIYRGRFLRRLRGKLAKKSRVHKSLPVALARSARTFREWDEHVTAPLHGFAGAEDYWKRSSSGPLLPSVRRPLLILAAEDDPFIPPEAIPHTAAAHNPHLTLEVSPEGGHVAFVQGPPWSTRRHAEQRAALFLAEHLRGVSF